MLCYDGQLQNSSVFTHSHSDSHTATSSATSNAISSARSKYRTVGEWPRRNEEPTSRIEEHTRKIPSSYIVLPQNLFID